MATKQQTPLIKSLIKDLETKIAVFEACQDADHKQSKGMINKNPSDKPLQAQAEAKIALEALKKEDSCPTQFNP